MHLLEKFCLVSGCPVLLFCSPRDINTDEKFPLEIVAEKIKGGRSSRKIRTIPRDQSDINMIESTYA